MPNNWMNVLIILSRKNNILILFYTYRLILTNINTSCTFIWRSCRKYCKVSLHYDYERIQTMVKRRSKIMSEHVSLEYFIMYTFTWCYVTASLHTWETFPNYTCSLFSKSIKDQSGPWMWVVFSFKFPIMTVHKIYLW